MKTMCPPHEHHHSVALWQLAHAQTTIKIDSLRQMFLLFTKNFPVKLYIHDC